MLRDEVDKYSHPLVRFYVEDILPNDYVQVLTLEMYQLGLRVAFVEISLEVVTLYRDFSGFVRALIRNMIYDWALGILHEKEIPNAGKEEMYETKG